MSDERADHLEKLQAAMRRNADIQRPTGWVSNLWGACAFCVTTSGAGVLAGHIGCLITPVVVTLAPSAAPFLGGDPYDPVLMFKIGAGVNAAVLWAWYDLRGRHVSRRIQMATVGVALAGLVATTAWNTPHMVDMQAAYQELTQGDPVRRAALIEDARSMGQTLDQRLMEICGEPRGPTARMTSWQKIRFAFTP